MNAKPIEPNDFPTYAPAWPAAPAGFADRVTAAVQSQHRVRRRQVWLVRAGGLALAASVAFALIAGLSESAPKPDVAIVPPSTQPTIAAPAKPTPIQKPFAEAGEALASMTRQTTDKALAPSKTMIASAERLPKPMPTDPKMNIETKGLTESATSARAGLDPVTDQPRRALNRMFRDFGIAPAKPRS